MSSVPEPTTPPSVSPAAAATAATADPEPPGKRLALTCLLFQLAFVFGVCLVRHVTRYCSEELCDMAFGCTLMEDPVVASDGHTYNRQDIQNWFDSHDTSPLTREPFEDKMLRPNIAIRKQIIRWREKQGLPAPTFADPAKARAGGGVGAAATQMSNTLCGFSKQPLQVFCINCEKAICLNCAIDPARCQSHNMRSLASIVSSVRDAHAAWLQLRDGRPQQLRTETLRVAAAANAAI